MSKSKSKRIALVVIVMVLVGASTQAEEYRGRYCEGKGDVQYLQLLDKSFGFFHPNWDTPNISMLYFPDWDVTTAALPPAEDDVEEDVGGEDANPEKPA